MSLLVDSSVWIDFFNGVQTPETNYLYDAIGHEPVIVGDLILTEVLQGFRNQQDFDAARQALTRFPVYEMVGQVVALQSARNYRSLRASGVTMRKTIDCLIATFCLMNDHTLLHVDRDFDYFEIYLGLSVLHL